MKKIFILFIFVFLLTGCTAEYKLDISKSTIEETISIDVDNDKLGTEGIEILKNTKQTVLKNNEEYYEQKFEQNADIFNVNYNYTYETNRFNGSNFISECFPDHSIANGADVLTISTEGSFTCYNRYGSEKVDNTRIVITTDLDVLDNNADEINGNNYVWEINEENYYDKPIYIQIDKRSFNVEDLILIISIIVGILLLALVIFIIMRFRYKNINKL